MIRILTALLMGGFFLWSFYGEAVVGSDLPIKTSLSVLSPSSDEEGSLNTFEGVSVTRPSATEARSDDDSTRSQDRCCHRERKQNDWAQGLSPTERRKWLKLALNLSSAPAPSSKKQQPSSPPARGSKGQR